ncbi:MAG: hypothetical protein D6722_01150 [Bacteroidetes bacterium]|nr:MAG: hypothetical protein D6722_01150 [Bacteroidota bacterium]
MIRVKAPFVGFIWFLLIAAPLWGLAQPSSAPRLYIKGENIQPDYVEIAYEINHAGFVELHLFSPENRKIWIKGKVSDRGDTDRVVDYIRVPRAPLEPGKRYTYQLKYKGKTYNGSFYNGS